MDLRKWHNYVIYLKHYMQNLKEKTMRPLQQIDSREKGAG
jgi:hypothetical protein